MKRAIPLIVILVIAGIATVAGFHQYFTYAALKEHHEELEQYVAAHPIQAALRYVGLYTVVVALSIPGVIEFFTIAAGVLFPQPQATVYAMIGATCGATAIFLVARFAFHDVVAANKSPKMQAITEGFRKNGAWYLLVLRLLPIVPFWFVNLAAGLFPIPVWAFALTTVVGCTPFFFAHVEIGEGLKPLLRTDAHPSFHALLNLKLELALGAVGGLVVVALLVKWLLQRKQLR